MKDYRPFIHNALKEIETNVPFKVKMAFPESINDGNVISYYELHNASSSLMVDEIAFQIDIWCCTELSELLTLMQAVDETMIKIGFLRQYSSPDSMLHDPSGYLRKSLRYGRRVETLTNRLID